MLKRINYKVSIIPSNFKFLFKNWLRRQSRSHDYINLFFKENRISLKKKSRSLYYKNNGKTFYEKKNFNNR